MKLLTVILAGLFISSNTCSQNKEFKVYDNGLIYNERTMSRLGYIVDSLNLKFKSCDMNKKYYSTYQATGHLVKLESGDIKAAKADMEKDIPVDAFLKKYPKATVQRDVIIIKYRYKDYEDKYKVEFEHFSLTNDYGFSITSHDLSLYEKDLQNKWLFDYYKGNSSYAASIQAFYFPNKFTSAEIPHKYALMIGYADCMVDTSVAKFKENTEDGWVELPADWTSLPGKKQTTLLDKMRSTRVIGYCSMDGRPREHALHIALLSAETAKWEVFLKAHLDIMNDRFERASDGSYAWGQRNTYINELEELNINVQDLVFGITFRIENSAKNHYYGSIGRMGRAIAETKNRAEMEQGMLSIISDRDLDVYNRLLFYFLFRNYAYHLKDESIKKECNEKIALARNTLPAYVQKQLNGN